MARRKQKNKVIIAPDTDSLIVLASERANPKRIKLPKEGLRLSYQDDVDTLYIHLKDNSRATHCETDTEADGVIYCYEGKKLVGIEILDISGQLKYANPL